eukprot:8349379-Pyramimonas_sp.AAC.1
MQRLNNHRARGNGYAQQSQLQIACRNLLDESPDLAHRGLREGIDPSWEVWKSVLSQGASEDQYKLADFVHPARKIAAR